jgi:four helix bundle protein
MNKDLNKRIFELVIRTFKYLRTIKDSVELSDIKRQLRKAVSSVGANYEESQAGSSKTDFLNKINITLKEIRETNYPLTSSPRRVD